MARHGGQHSGGPLLEGQPLGGRQRLGQVEVDSQLLVARGQEALQAGQGGAGRAAWVAGRLLCCLTSAAGSHASPNYRPNMQIKQQAFLAACSHPTACFSCRPAPPSTAASSQLRHYPLLHAYYIRCMLLPTVPAASTLPRSPAPPLRSSADSSTSTLAPSITCGPESTRRSRKQQGRGRGGRCEMRQVSLYTIDRPGGQARRTGQEAKLCQAEAVQG